ncbi:MAG TPA: hypothetical protein PKI94_01400 [Candidatus Gastranaerophilaceae bacterium]|nr:hypothetical protein [Candidatus Gastranaerophilaceae bacterium]
MKIQRVTGLQAANKLSKSPNFNGNLYLQKGIIDSSLEFSKKNLHSLFDQIIPKDFFETFYKMINNLSKRISKKDELPNVVFTIYPKKEGLIIEGLRGVSNRNNRKTVEFLPQESFRKRLNDAFLAIKKYYDDFDKAVKS